MASKVIPGAPPPAASKAKKKSKKQSGPASASKPQQVPDAASAALIEQSPAGPTEVASELKVSSTDLAEEAEKQTAIAAVEAIEHREGTPTSSAKTERSAIQTLITKRATVVRKKLQRVQGYEHLDKAQLNADQVRNLAAKPTFEAVHHELQELGKAIDSVEREEKEAVAARVAEARREAEQSSKSRIVLLLQFLHLFNLYFPNQANPSFAPQQNLPAALQNATGQEVAALGKIFDQLANGPLEGGHGDALEVLANIEAGSAEEALPDVTYATIQSMILKLTAPPADAAGHIVPATEKDAVASSSPVAQMVFMQEDEVNEQSEPTAPITAEDAVEAKLETSEEPAGGAPEPLAAPDVATESGEAGGKGIVLGLQEPTDAAADGSAAAAVDEPVNTTEVAKEEPAQPASEQVATAPAAVSNESGFNWADDADDGDLPEAPVFASLTPVTATQSNTPAESSTPAPEVTPAAAPTPVSNPASPAANKERKPRNANGGGGAGRGGAARNGHGLASRQPLPKPQPIVDEDGFILQESKKSRMLAQQQQRRQESSRGRGGRGGARGGAAGGARGGRGGAANGGPRQSTGGEGTARPKAPRKGRAAAPEGANASPAS